jgi:hypothetical protein
MPDPSAGAHHLHIPGLEAADVAEAVPVGDNAFADIGHDLDVGVVVRRKSRVRSDLVIVPDIEIGDWFVRGISDRPDGEVVFCA